MLHENPEEVVGGLLVPIKRKPAIIIPYLRRRGREREGFDAELITEARWSGGMGYRLQSHQIEFHFVKVAKPEKLCMCPLCWTFGAGLSRDPCPLCSIERIDEALSHHGTYEVWLADYSHGRRCQEIISIMKTRGLA